MLDDSKDIFSQFSMLIRHFNTFFRVFFKDFSVIEFRALVINNKMSTIVLKI